MIIPNFIYDKAFKSYRSRNRIQHLFEMKYGYNYSTKSVNAYDDNDNIDYYDDKLYLAYKDDTSYSLYVRVGSSIVPVTQNGDES